MDAYGVNKEFGEVMKAQKHSRLPGKEAKYEYEGETVVDLKHLEEEKETLIKKKMAVTAFTITFQDNHDQYYMTMPLNFKTEEWPSGHAWEIVQELHDEFAPTGMMGQAERQRELEAIHMKRTANPKILFSQITTIENKYRERTSALTKNKS